MFATACASEFRTADEVSETHVPAEHRAANTHQIIHALNPLFLGFVSSKFGLNSNRLARNEHNREFLRCIRVRKR